MSNQVLEGTKFVSELTAKKWVNILLALILAGAGFVIHHQDEELKKRDVVIHDNNTRYISNIDTLESRLEKCNMLRIKDVSDSQKYWRDKFEALEKRSHEGYRRLNKK